MSSSCVPHCWRSAREWPAMKRFVDLADLSREQVLELLRSALLEIGA